MPENCSLNYILRVNDFDKIATTPLDEWIEFLKTGKIDDNTKAAGLAEARKQLRVDSLPDKERRAYERYMESVRHMRSLFDTSHDDGYTEGHAEGRAAGLVEGRAEGRAAGLVEGRAAGLVEGRAERSLEIARQLKAMGMSKEQIMQATGLQESDIQHL